MKILEVRMKGLKRLKSNVKLYGFKYLPHEMVQILLGRNGSGKSTVLRYMFPMPIRHTELEKDGVLGTDIQHNGSMYSCTVTGEGSYSFIVDGVEFNKSHAITTQRSLVFEHFGLNQSILDFILDDTTFIKMSPAVRKAWLTDVSHVDYDYAMSVYTKAYKSYKDNKAVLAYLNKQYLTETARVMDAKELHLLGIEVGKLRYQLEEYLSLKDVNIDVHFSTEDVLEPVINDIKLLKLETVKMRQKLSGQKLSTDDIITISEELVTRKVTLEQLKTDTSKQIVELDDILGSADSNKANELAGELKQMKILLKDKPSFNYPIEFTNVQDASASLSSQLDSLRDSLYQMDSSVSMEFSSTEYHLLQEKQVQLKNKLTETKAKHDQYSVRLTHLLNLKSEDKEQCPNCNHSWHKLYDPVEHTSVDKDITAIIDEENRLEGLLGPLESKLEAWSEWRALYIRFMQLKSSGSLDSLWKYVSTPKMIRYPDKVAVILTTADNYLKECCEYIEFERQYDAMEQELARYVKLDEISVATKLRLSKLELRFKEITDELNIISPEINKLTRLKAEVAALDDKKQFLHTKLESVMGNITKEFKASEQTIYNERIADIKSKIAELEIKTTQGNVLQDSITGLKKSIDEKNEEVKILKELVETLSPNTGIIADSLYGFIDGFVDMVNGYLSHIWEGDMYIEYPDRSKKLNYKFQVMKDGVIVEDISNGSRGMKNSLALAIKLSILDLLGMQEYPFILDEFGANLDESNISASYRFIADTMSTMEYTNIFVATHAMSALTTFNASDVDFIALDKYAVNLVKGANNVNTGLLNFNDERI